MPSIVYETFFGSHIDQKKIASESASAIDTIPDILALSTHLTCVTGAAQCLCMSTENQTVRGHWQANFF
jgi:hypothetical protein